MQPAYDELAGRRAQRHKLHRWTRWRDAVGRQFPELPSRALTVLDELVRRADNDTGHCWHHLAKIEEATHLGQRTIQRAVDDLVGAGLVRAEGQRGRRRIDFWLVPLAELETDVLFRAKLAEKRQSDVTPDVNESGEKRQSDVTVATLTGVDLPQTTEPPRPPGGGRKRDLDQYRTELRRWAAQEQLPLEHVAHIEAAMGGLRPARNRAAVVAYLETWTPWREQLTLDLTSESEVRS